MPNSAYLSRKVANEVVRNLASSDMVTLFRINELNSDSYMLRRRLYLVKSLSV